MYYFHRPFSSISHESKFKSNVRDEYKDGKYEHRTMGYADEPLPNPSQYLKKKPNDSKSVARKFSFSFLMDSIFFVEKETAATNKDRSPQRKPPVPSIRDAPKMGARTEKNFVQTNALDVVMTVPKKPERNIVDDRFGDKYQVDPSGLQPKYVFKKVRISTFIHSLFVSV